MNEHSISRFAVYLLSAVMLVFGIYHLMYPKMWLVYVPEFIPGGILWVYFTGIAFIGAALAFVTNRMVKLAGYLLAALLLVFVLTIHLPNYLNSGDAEMRQQAFASLLKDTAILGFALFIAANARHQRINEADDEAQSGKVRVLEPNTPATV
jgi:uncharacterized membrane protein